MAKKPPSPPVPAVETVTRPAVTAERFRRLVRLIQFLGPAPRSRAQLLAHLQIDIRGFYRDLELLRAVSVDIALHKGTYHLPGALEDILPLLPFPDLHLTLGEMRQLARGRSRVHQRLEHEIKTLLS